MNLYEFEEHADNWPVPKRGLVLHPHTFQLDRTLWRMVCEACGGKMNEAPFTCPGRKE